MSKKKLDDIIQPQTLSSQIGHHKELLDSPAWKTITATLDKMMGEIKEKLWLPCTDETPKFNANHLLKERLTVMYIFMNLPKISLDNLENMLATEENRNIPTLEKLENEHKKLSNELLKYIKI